MEKSYQAAVVQMNSQANLKENLEQAYHFIRQAAKEGSLLVALPENFSFLGGLDMRLEHVDEIAERVPAFLAETANEFNIYLLGGSYPVPAPNGKAYNHSVLIGPGGNEILSYNKIHLFDVILSDKEAYKESSYIQYGQSEVAVAEGRGIGNIGLSVCYDLRFPELYRKLSDQGAEILAVPSAFTYTTGKDHWEVLLRARAIENTAYVIAPAQTGRHGPDRRTWGHSMIVDPWGKVLADAGSEAGIAIAEIDAARLDSVRNSIPSLKHRRLNG